MHKLKGVAAVALIAVTGCVTNTDIGTVNEEVTEAESKLVFNGPGLEDGYRKIISGTVSGRLNRQTLGHYGPKKGQFPFASIVMYESTRNDIYYPRETVEDSLAGWTNYSENPPAVGPTYRGQNSIGVIRYAAYQDEDANCIAFTQSYGSKVTGKGAANTLSGYYCRGGDTPISKDEGAKIVAAVGHRDYGDVPLSELRAAQIAEVTSRVKDLSGHYVVDWPGLTASEVTKITFVGQESGAFFFKTDDLGHCDGDYDVTAFGKDSIVGSWKLACGDYTASGKFDKGAAGSGVEIRAVGQDETGREVSFAK